MPSLTTRIAGRCACVGVLPPGAAPDLSVDGRGLSNEKTHGVPEVTSGQDTKTRHPTTIGAQEAPDPGSLHSARKAVGHDGRKSMPKYEFNRRSCQARG